MTPTHDYDLWLEKVKAAVQQASSIAGIARWIAPRLGTTAKSAQVKIHNVISQSKQPRAPFVCAMQAWMDAGCPTPKGEDGRKTVSAETKHRRALAGAAKRWKS